MQTWPGASYPLGATFDGNRTNFALFSEGAERVELCLFDHRGKRFGGGRPCPGSTSTTPSSRNDDGG